MTETIVYRVTELARGFISIGIVGDDLSLDLGPVPVELMTFSVD